MDNQIPERIQTLLNNGQEIRSMAQPLEARADEENEWVVEGYACTFNQPYELFRDGTYCVMEQIDPHAFDGCDMSDVIMQLDHQGRVFARNKNGTLTFGPDGHGLKTRAMLGGTALGRDIHGDIKGGYLNKMSFRFRVGEDKREVMENHDTGMVTVTRTITKITKLLDVSVVSIPANDATEIYARSMVDGVIDWARQELNAERDKQQAKARFHYRLKMMEMN